MLIIIIKIKFIIMNIIMAISALMIVFFLECKSFTVLFHWFQSSTVKPV